MNLNYQPLFDDVRKIYRLCKWCQGRGCLSCEAEADKEYARQFPAGPKPIATIPLDRPLDLNTEEGVKTLKAILKAHMKEEQL